METAEKLITENLDVWTSAVKAKSSVGRGSSSKRELYGIQRLRELILELAVRGMLVPQNPDEESSEELLKRIATQKAQLIDDGKIRKQPKQPPVDKDEFPFPLPPGWMFERIGNLTSKLGSGSTPRGGKSAYVPEGIIFLRSQNVWNDGLRLDDTAYIPEETHEAMNNTQVFPRDVLLNITGASLGRSTIFPEELVTANVSQHVTIIRLVEPEMAEFLHLGILSPLVQKLVWGRQVGMAIEGLSKKVLEKFEFPIPPLAEQQRIVAKVDELMALCDQLEQEQENSLETHDTLVRTLLDALTSSTANASSFADAWQRIQVNFDTLFTTESSIGQLKQTILQLAVMGKLIPQNPNDEPADKLIKRISVERVKLIEDGKLKKQKKTANPPSGETERAVPSGWVLAPFGDVVYNRDAERVPLSVDTRKTRQGDFDYYGASGVIDSIDDYLFDKPLLLIGEDGANLINRSTPIAFMARGKYWVNNHAHVLDGISETLLLYVCLHINAISLEPYVTGTAQPKMNQVKMNSITLALPPENEQHRIVAKVDELMALCDQLKANLATAQATQLKLADSLVEQAVG